MTAAARDVLVAFDALPPDEQHRVAAELLRGTAAADDLLEAALNELAADLLRGDDAEEAARAGP
jgi:hypothetical protein